MTTPRTNIFFPGTVHEAIVTSLEQHIALVCFVTDGGDEGAAWESQYLKDREIFELLQNDVILLRLEAGSREAGMLAAVCPVQEIPHLLIIKDRAILLKLTSGVSREEFLDSVRSVLQRPSSPTPSSTASQSSPPLQATVASAAAMRPLVSPPSTAPPAAASLPLPSASASGSQGLSHRVSPAPATPEPERTESPGPPPRQDSTRRASLRPSGQTYIEQQRQKKLAEQAEKQRILQLLENDKAERRVRERDRRDSITPGSITPQPEPWGDEVALSFRLTDGANVKSRFPPSAVLGVDVRGWIESNRTDGDRPYNFMEILGPARNHSLDISDESVPLGQLFRRSATLVLVPTTTFTSEAYESAARTGVISQAYGMISGALSAVWNLTTFSPRAGNDERPGPPPPPLPQSGSARPGGGPHRNDRVRTLHDRNDENERRYYNGNQLSFEPKPGDNQG